MHTLQIIERLDRAFGGVFHSSIFSREGHVGKMSIDFRWMKSFRPRRKAAVIARRTLRHAVYRKLWPGR